MKNVKERRKHHRKECALRADYEIDEKEYSGFVSDVSLGGMCLKVPRKHNIGEKIVVTLLSGGKRTDIILRGVVAYMLEADGYWRLGVEFDELNQAAMEAVAFYLVT